MAKRPNEHETGGDKGGMRILYVELNGNNSSLQEGLRTLVAAMNKPVQVASAPPRRFVANSSPAASSTNGAEVEADLFSAPQEAMVGADTEQAVEPAVTQNGAPRRRRGDGEKVNRNAGLVAVPNLDFVPSGKMALKAFFATKSPSNDMEQLLVLAYYLQNTLELGHFSPGHLLSALKHVGKPVPVDLRKTVYNMKKSKVWLDFADVDQITVTTEGENVVEHELPRSISKGAEGTK